MKNSTFQKDLGLFGETGLKCKKEKYCSKWQYVVMAPSPASGATVILCSSNGAVQRLSSPRAP